MTETEQHRAAYQVIMEHLPGSTFISHEHHPQPEPKPEPKPEPEKQETLI